MPNKKKTSVFKILKETGSEFLSDNVTKLAASLSYYTVFSIGPLLLLIISLCGLFMDPIKVSDTINGQLLKLLGPQAADQIKDIIFNLQKQQGAARWSSIVSAITLFIGATGVFLEIQDSVNYIWSIKSKPKKGWLRLITNRLLSFSLIVGIGFLLIVSLMINSVTDLLTQRLEQHFGSGEVLLFKGLNIAILFAIITVLFAVIYKVLPDGKIHWRDAFVGAGFTGILFLGGKFGIGAYLGTSSTTSTYGAAAAVIYILLWVYYSAIILYFGAEFTKVWALRRGHGIRPNATAVLITKHEERELQGKTYSGPDEVKVEVSNE